MVQGRVSVLKLVNGSTGDPSLYLDFPGRANAVLFDAGTLAPLSPEELGDLSVVLLTHFHMDHFLDFDRVLRFNVDRKKTIRVFGPPGTIERVGRKLAAYVLFAFARITFEVTDLDAEATSWPRARFAAKKGFAREDLSPARATKSRRIVDSRECRIYFAPASHSIPCISYALDVKRGWRFDPVKAETGVLKPGPWIGKVLAELDRPKADRKCTVRVEKNTGSFALADLVEGYFALEPSWRIAFVTDTRDDPAVRDGLVELVRGSKRFYGDCYYGTGDEERAEKYGHMTAPAVAALARDAEVESLHLMHFAPKYHGRPHELLEQARAVFEPTHMHVNSTDHTDPGDD